MSGTSAAARSIWWDRWATPEPYRSAHARRFFRFSPRSGGPNLYAKSDKIYILRQSSGQQERLNFNYKKALKGNDPKADFPLVNGDVIVVP